MLLCQPAVNYHHLSLIHSSPSLPCRVAVCYFSGCSSANWTGFPLKLLSFSKWHHTAAAGFNQVFPEDKPPLHYSALSISYSIWSIMCSKTCFRGCFLQAASWEKYHYVALAGLCAWRWDAAVWPSFAGVCCDPEGGHCRLHASHPSEVQDQCLSMPFQLTDTLWPLLPCAGHNRASLFLAVKINSEYDR